MQAAKAFLDFHDHEPLHRILTRLVDGTELFAAGRWAWESRC